MKLKNLKAQGKRVKTEDNSMVERLDGEESEQDESINNESPKSVSLRRSIFEDGSITSSIQKVSRKRSKIWTAEETDQLTDLVEKHFHCLDTSLTRESLGLRSQAWDSIVEEFNISKSLAAKRDMSELKIKLKNMKAKRTNFKTESDSGHEAVEQSFIEVEPIPEEIVKIKRSKPLASTPILHNNSLPARNHRSSAPMPTRFTPKVKTFELVVDSLDPIANDYSDEDDVSFELN